MRDMSDKNSRSKKNEKDDNEHYRENGNNFKPGTEEKGTLPNNPAENAEKTSPEEDEQNKKDDAKE